MKNSSYRLASRLATLDVEGPGEITKFVRKSVILKFMKKWAKISQI